MTKPIIVVKVPCKLLYVIQVKEFLIKYSTSWPYLISEFLVAYITIVASDWPRTFFTPKVFLFSIDYIYNLCMQGVLDGTIRACWHVYIQIVRVRCLFEGFIEGYYKKKKISPIEKYTTCAASITPEDFGLRTPDSCAKQATWAIPMT